MQAALAIKNRSPSRFEAPAPALARAHASVRHILRGSHVQPKLKIGAANDPAEREADRVADQVMRMPMPMPGPGISGLSASGKSIQRMCAGCEDELQRKPEGEEELQRKQLPGASPALSVSSEGAIRGLSGGGTPLPASERAFFEPRFGQDFSSVRIHNGAAADSSARSINARAFTLGSDIAFARGEYAPGSSAGRRLMAHELTHVGQQREKQRLQRFANCHTVTMSGIDCPAREEGELGRARQSNMIVAGVSNGERGQLVANFEIGSDQLKPNLALNPDWNIFKANVAAHPEVRWNILGFSDCSGSQDVNAGLRDSRAQALFGILPATVQAQIDDVRGAPLNDCIANNVSEMARSLNRSVFIMRSRTVYDFEGETVDGERAEFVCGPDVTSAVEAAITATRSAFAGWTSDERTEACDALDDTDTGICAWDIVPLHNHGWITSIYRPPCATRIDNVCCGRSVQVGDDCYYAGSANYVIFGVMGRLCFNHFAGIPDLGGAYRFRKKGLLYLIDLYKGGKIPFFGRAPNYIPSRQWAEAGYDGWPSGGTPPSGDCPQCAPLCSSYSGQRFHVNWWPRQYYTGGGKCGR